MSALTAQADHELLLALCGRCRFRARCLRRLCRHRAGGDLGRFRVALAVGAKCLVSRRASHDDWHRGRRGVVRHHMSADHLGEQAATSGWRNRSRRVVCRALGPRSAVLRRAALGVYRRLLRVRGRCAGDFRARAAKALAICAIMLRNQNRPNPHKFFLSR